MNQIVDQDIRTKCKIYDFIKFVLDMQSSVDIDIDFIDIDI